MILLPVAIISQVSSVGSLLCSGVCPMLAECVFVNTQVFSGCSQCLKPNSGEEGVHADLAQLLGQLDKANENENSLSLASRLYGEKTLQFVEVCEVNNVDIMQNNPLVIKLDLSVFSVHSLKWGRMRFCMSVFPGVLGRNQKVLQS